MDDMPDQDGFRVLNRLRRIEWDADWDDAYFHVISRQLLMREYMRRAALWAEFYSAEEAWPFFDITNYAAPELKLPQSLSRDLNEFLRTRMVGLVMTTCAGAVRLAELRAQDPATGEPNLPELYEPLLVMYERGGDFMRDNSGALDLTGVSFRPGTMQDYLGDTPIVTVRASVLDALDAEGRITFFASDTGHGPVLRRRLLPGGEERYEVFSDRLNWDTAGGIHTQEKGAEGVGYAQITPSEAARIIEAMMSGPTAKHGG
ncbi:hypothetical protein [Streptomyces sindenensis]|uniref:hypothetical protein n=1 Tax=Streptomyces sindenensis TaxID=67363 RepID=UPI00167BD0F5|nr:hypothetical protein [Streptomyces sindenensis]GGP35291.1 hypothetical protein GCM10010231_02700 [Streptomyces sindenensis]